MHLRTVPDGPRTPPILNVNYTGQSGPIDSGQVVTATCGVRHAGGGTLLWVVYLPAGNRAFLYNARVLL